jgi:hypothetical protein
MNLAIKYAQYGEQRCRNASACNCIFWTKSVICKNFRLAILLFLKGYWECWNIGIFGEKESACSLSTVAIKYTGTKICKVLPSAKCGFKKPQRRRERRENTPKTFGFLCELSGSAVINYFLLQCIKFRLSKHYAII